MKRCAFLMCILFCVGAVLARPIMIKVNTKRPPIGVYSMGTKNYQERTIEWIDVSSMEQESCIVQGYLINSCEDGNGCYVVKFNEDNTYTILRFWEGYYSETSVTRSSERLLQVLAYKNGEVYEVIECPSDEIGYILKRTDIKGSEFVYPIQDYGFSLIPYHDRLAAWTNTSTWSVSGDGKIAYYRFDYEWLPFAGYKEDAFWGITPEEKVSDLADWAYESLGETDEYAIIEFVSPEGTIVEVGQGTRPVWLNENQLLYEKENTLYCYYVKEGSSSAFLTEKGSEVQIRPKIGNMTIDPSREWLVYWKRVAKDVDEQSISQSVCLISLKTGQEYILPRVSAYAPMVICLAS